MIRYVLEELCAGVLPTFYLLDEAMLQHFSGCPGGLPEAPLIDSMWPRVRDRDGLFVDVGAHVGSWAVTYAAAGKSVIAFEPNPVIHPLLRRALPAARRIALGDRDGVARLSAQSADGGTGSIVREFGAGRDYSVRLLTLDDCISPATQVAAIKIDVEGAEVDVLRGARQTIARCHPLIFFECWEDERGQRKDELFAMVRELGYEAKATGWPEMWIAENTREAGGKR